MTSSDSTSTPISAIMARRLAHAIRSPLSAIDGGFAELSDSPSVASDPVLLRYAALGRQSVRQLVDLAERFECIGLVETMAEKPADEPPAMLQWPDVIRRCVEVHCVERQGRNRKRVDVSIAEAVGEGRAHRKASERALAELLDNAVRHARTAVQVTADVDGEYLRVRIGDDGPGLPNGGVDPFAPPRKVASRMGMGLWLAERLAGALQGSVGVERTGDEGTVMWLRIPVSARLDSDPAG